MDFSHVLGPETTLKSAKKVQIIRENIFHKKKKNQHIDAIRRDISNFQYFFSFFSTMCVSPPLSINVILFANV